MTSLRVARLAHATRPRAWAAVAQQAEWECRSRFEHRPAVPLTWPVPEDVRPQLSVLWPERYASRNAPDWVEPIRRGIAHQIRVEDAAIPQPGGNVVTVLFRRNRSTMRVAIDYDDLAELHTSVSDHDLYFKMQFRRDGYGVDYVVPGGYVSNRDALYRHVDRWRALRARGAGELPVFARFGTRRAIAVRTAMLELVQSQDAFPFGGQGAPTTWWEYMQDVCRAAICLDAPGRGELCRRLVECLAVGSCVVGPVLGNELHVPLEDGVHHVRVRRDLSDLVGTCAALLADRRRRERLSEAARRYFDAYLRTEQLGGYYIDRCLDRLG